MKVTSLALAFAVGIAVGLALFAFLEGFGQEPPEGPVDDPREIGLPLSRLILGFGAQAAACWCSGSPPRRPARASCRRPSGGSASSAD